MHLTPDMLEAAYSYLLTTRPFRRWSLPPADEVEFHVTRHKKQFGDHELFDGRHIIRVSERRVGRTLTLMETVAHEMVHMHCDRKGVRSEHGAAFRRYAAPVCREHGFDPLTF